MEFAWKLKGLANGVDPSIAAEELSRLQNLYGSITPELLVNEATNPKSVLHSIFEWDDHKAAHGYRLQQARILLNNIQITVISDGEAKEISVYEVTSYKGGYKRIDTLLPNDLDYIRTTTKAQLGYLSAKLRTFNNFAKTVSLIENASSSLDEVLTEIEHKKKKPIDLSNK
jgi:hypothetical protein